MNIGLIGLSAKPFTAGHMGLIQIASNENDEVFVYVSLSTRARPNEMPVYEDDMREIWTSILLNIMPQNVNVEFVPVPIRSIYEKLGEADVSGSEDEFKIYSDPVDLEERFGETQLKKYTPTLFSNGQVIPRAIQRTETVDVSGTKMRAAVASGDFETFKKGMPKGTAQAIWDILSKHASEVTPEKKVKAKKKPALENFIRKYVRQLLF